MTNKIDYQKLREIAEKTKIAGEAPVMPFDQRINALNDFMKHFSPDIALALLDEVKRLEDTNIDAMCRIAEFETNLAALAAENAGLKSAHPQPFGPEMMKALDAHEKHQDEVPEAGMLDAFFILRDSIRVETPATDAFLAEVKTEARKEGAYFVANRMLAAWEAGFIDDTAKNAADIARMILTSTEFMANAPEGDFDRSFSDGVLEDIAEQLRKGVIQ